VFGNSIVCNDIDGDGDLDIVVGRFIEAPDIYLNDGRGYFTLQENDFPVYENEDVAVFTLNPYLSLGLADFNGDEYPDLLMGGLGYMVLYPNDGTGTFLEPETLHVDSMEEGLGLYLSVSFGDVDRDNDLDILLASNVTHNDMSLHPDYLFENVGGFDFTLSTTFHASAEGSRTLVGSFTDFDQDGDQDIFVNKDWLGKNAFWVNDGQQNWSNQVQSLGLDYDWAAMGLESIDFNQDNQMDYCATDVQGLWCLMSDEDGKYTDTTLSMGLYDPDIEDDEYPVAWTVLLNDLDNDQYLDLMFTGGPMAEEEGFNITDISDEIWRGGAAGFEYATDYSGFGDRRDHYGMVQADFDSDGSLETVISGPNHPPVFYDNIPNNYNWIDVELEGIGANKEGWGARIEVTAGDQIWTRELLSSVGQAQGAPRMHFGLGESRTVDTITVFWTDGHVTEMENVSGDRLFTVIHE